MHPDCVTIFVQASAQIMRLLASTCPGCAFEKASIDEAYLDITQLAVSDSHSTDCKEHGEQQLASVRSEQYVQVQVEG